MEKVPGGWILSMAEVGEFGGTSVWFWLFKWRELIARLSAACSFSVWVEVLLCGMLLALSIGGVFGSGY